MSADAAAQNARGLAEMRAGNLAAAEAAFARAVAADPRGVPLWLNLADARRRVNDRAGEIDALDGALTIDPYLLPGLLLKAAALEAVGGVEAAAAAYRALFAAYPDRTKLSGEVAAAFDHGDAVLRARAAARATRFAAATAPLHAGAPGADRSRLDVYLAQLAGQRRVYAPEPSGGHFPFLPAHEFFDEALFPWFVELEAATDAICRELAGCWSDGGDALAPYVAFAAGVPVNQWRELNNSPRWSAFFLWKDGARQEANLARCPATAALIETLPLIDIPGKAPTVMFSILAPGTRIPPHTGTTNVRTTVHLPLVVPDGCGFRVGGDTRTVRMGKAWAFDDTIEHEAWNDADRPRAILILDTWNPLLTPFERDAVRAVGA